MLVCKPKRVEESAAAPRETSMQLGLESGPPALRALTMCRAGAALSTVCVFTQLSQSSLEAGVSHFTHRETEAWGGEGTCPRYGVSSSSLHLHWHLVSWSCLFYSSARRPGGELASSRASVSPSVTGLREREQDPGAIPGPVLTSCGGESLTLSASVFLSVKWEW